MDRLTFGVEFEFLIAYIPPPFDTNEPLSSDPEPEDTRNARFISHIVCYGDEFETPGKVSRSHVFRDTFKSIVSTLNRAGIECRGLGDFSGEEAEESFWIVKTDQSLAPNGKEGSTDSGYKWIPIEVVSPAFYHSEKAIQQVEEVIAILSNTYRIQVNQTTGLHVHVGYGYSGYTPQVLRNFMALIWTFEDNIALIHPKGRRGDLNRHCRSVRSSSTLRLYHLRRVESQDILAAGLEIILACNDDDDILPRQALFANRNGYNALSTSLKNLRLNHGWEAEKNTVEFRQHESTLDPEAVRNWIAVCAGLVEFADSCPPVLMDRLCRDHIDDRTGTYSLRQLLCAIGLPLQAKYYGNKLAARAKRKAERAHSIRDLSFETSRSVKGPLPYSPQEIQKFLDQHNRSRETPKSQSTESGMSDTEIDLI